MVLKDPQTNKCLKNPVHVNRLKMAHVREPTPRQYFQEENILSETLLVHDESITKKDKEINKQEEKEPVLRRSSRCAKFQNAMEIELI